ncbi:MAG: tripartite tricarboxylate transporter substrate binding protein [Pseudomonadota bacterium]
MRRRSFVPLALSAAAFPGAYAQTAGGYPNRPLKLVVTYPPGGSSDLMCRIMAQKMGALWGQQVLVDNRAGAAGALGMEFAARQPPDGYTILFGNIGPGIINPMLSKVPYDTAKDFIPISLVATGACAMVVNSNSPYHTLDQFLAAARAKPGGQNFGSAGPGSLSHLFGEMLNRSGKIQAVHVPYKGGVAAVTDLLAGQIDFMINEFLPLIQHIRSGRLRALAVSGEKRSPQLPEVPTFVESGFPDMVALNSWMVYLQAGTPKPVVEQVRTTLAKAMKDPDLVRQFYDMGVEALSSTPEQLQKFTAAEAVKFGRLIKERNIHGE